MFWDLAPVLLKETEYMSPNTKYFHLFVLDIASYSMYILELLSVAIIVFTTVMAFFKLFRHERYARVYLLHGQSIGLTFKLGAEILRTVTATSLMDIIEVFLLIVIKACMVLLIERELRSSDETEIHTTGEGMETPHVQHAPDMPRKYRFSLFHTETQLAPQSPEAEALQQKITQLQSQLDAIQKSDAQKTDSDKS